MADYDVLRKAIESGILDINTIQSQVEMAKRDEYLAMHPYKIFKSSDGYWHTYLPKGDGKRKPVKKKEQADIEAVVIKYWSDKDNETFSDRYKVWIERQRAVGRTENTILKYESDFKRFFSNYPIETMVITDVTEEVLGRHFTQVLQDKDIPYRAFKEMFGYVKGVFRKCEIDRVIKPEENPCLYIDIPIYQKYCKIDTSKNARYKTLSEKEQKAMKRNIANKINEMPEFIPTYAVKLAQYTGMRVSELAALRWDHIDYEEGIIIISKSEKMNKRTKERWIANTKNSKVREFPLTDKIIEILKEIKKVEMEHGWLGEYVFMDADGRVHMGRISRCARKVTGTSDFYNVKCITSLRRSLNSTLRCNGVSATVASSLLGHTSMVNQRNYTEDVYSNEAKKELVSNIINF